MIKYNGAVYRKAVDASGLVTFIGIGRNTTTNEIYDKVDAAMIAIYNGQYEAFRLGAYVVRLEEDGWDVFRDGTYGPIAHYPDKQSSTYRMVDDWMDSRHGWASKDLDQF